MAQNYNNFYDRNRKSFSPQGNKPRSMLPHETQPLRVPSNYVDIAEQTMRTYFEKQEECHGRKITTTKLRNLLSLVSEVYNVENLRTERQLLPESVTKLNLMRMRAAYECGRDATTKDFVWPAKIMEYLKWFSTAQPDSRAGLIDFYHSMEALVAFHRYLGGSEN